jgi:hypothetical protein
MSTDLNALFSAMNRGDVFAITDQLFPRTAVSSAIPEPQQPMCRYPDLVEGSSPCADTGTAGVSGSSDRVLIEQYRRTVGEYERAFRRLKSLLDQDNLDDARDIVGDVLRGIDGPNE